MGITFSVSVIRQYKGAALSCLVLLALSPLPVEQEWLERNSGYTDKPVSQALAYLRENGVVDHSRAGWFLTDGTVQMALGWVESEEKLSTGLDELSTGYPQKMALSRKNSDSSLIIIKDSIKGISGDLELEELNNNNHSSRNNSDSQKPEVWQLLARFGIRENDRTRAMVEKEHVNVEFVQAVIARLEASGRGGARHAGLLITECGKSHPVVESVESRGANVTDLVTRFLEGRK